MVSQKLLLLLLLTVKLLVLAHLFGHVYPTLAAEDSEEATLPTVKVLCERVPLSLAAGDSEEAAWPTAKGLLHGKILATSKNITAAAEYCLSPGLTIPRRRLRSIGARQGPVEPPTNATG